MPGLDLLLFVRRKISFQYRYDIFFLIVEGLWPKISRWLIAATAAGGILASRSAARLGSIGFQYLDLQGSGPFVFADMK